MKRGEYLLAKRLVRFFPERWEPVGRGIWNGTREIGSLATPLMAQYVCAMHNVFLPLLNRLLLITRRLRDVDTLEIKNDND